MFEARLVNPPHGDPALCLRFPPATPSPEGIVYLLDCGSLLNMPHSDLLRVRRLFISHTHIDHAIGLDHLLRIQLFSERPLEIYGPPGLIEQFAGRLRGYAWNLIGDSPFQVHLHELHPEKIVSRELPCRDQFRPGLFRRRRQRGPLMLAEGCSVSWFPLEHGVPCLGYRFTSRPFFRFREEEARKLGFSPGPWIRQLKSLAESGSWKTALDPGLPGKSTTVRKLADQLLEQDPLSTLVYITDTLLGQEQRVRFLPFVQDCQQLWCEATYCQADLDKAAANLHATASQAACLARDAHVGRLCLFHLSRRYQGDTSRHLAEAQAVFSHTYMGETL